jgi:uncharacterized protein
MPGRKRIRDLYLDPNCFLPTAIMTTMRLDIHAARKMARHIEARSRRGRGSTGSGPESQRRDLLDERSFMSQDREVLPRRLSVVTLGARDLPRLRRFYRSLGWEEVPGGSDEWAAFLLGGAVLALYPVETLADEAGAELPASGWSGITLAVNVDSPRDVDAALAGAVTAGADPVSPAQRRTWGGRSGYFADPEGNRWEVAWAPGVVFDEKGALASFGG